MNTPAHLVFGLTAFGRPNQTAVTIAALIGSFLPDLSLYLMAGICLFVLGMSPQRVFDELYFSDSWQQVFAIDNSFVLWGIALAVCLWRRSAKGVALTGAAILHLMFDFPLHHDDARRHFWPISNWVFESPYSYWDRAHHGGVISWIENALVAVMAVVLVMRFRAVWPRIGIALLAGMQLVPFIMFSIMFG